MESAGAATVNEVLASTQNVYINPRPLLFVLEWSEWESVCVWARVCVQCAEFESSPTLRVNWFSWSVTWFDLQFQVRILEGCQGAKKSVCSETEQYSVLVFPYYFFSFLSVQYSGNKCTRVHTSHDFPHPVYNICTSSDLIGQLGR